MTDEPIPTAVLGASGYIGQHFVRMLDSHPSFRLAVLGATARSEGKTMEEIWVLTEPFPSGARTARLVHATPGELARRGIRVVFSALPSGTAGAVETECRRRGIHVFTNAADHRMDPDVPLVIPEVNGSAMVTTARARSRRALLVANPNCSTTGLLLSLCPILRALRPRQVFAATYQSLSGAGYPGVPSLAISDNVVPFIPEEEEKMARESQKILAEFSGMSRGATPPPVLAHCARVGVREGHLQAVTIEATRAPTVRELRAAWAGFDPLSDSELQTAPHPPVEIRGEADRPQPARDRWAGAPPAARGMAAVVGRVRWEPPYLRYFTLSHNAVRGGAGGSILNAELALRHGLLGDHRGRSSS